MIQVRPNFIFEYNYANPVNDSVFVARVEATTANTAHNSVIRANQTVFPLKHSVISSCTYIYMYLVPKPGYGYCEFIKQLK